MVNLGAEFYPPAPPEQETPEEEYSELDFVQPIVAGQPTATGEIPLPEEPPKPKKRAVRKKTAEAGGEKVRRTRRKKTS
jgi:hypothetical protein